MTIPQPLIVEQQSTAKEERRQSTRYALELISGLFLLATVVVSALSTRAAIQSVNQSRLQFEKDQRPYVLVRSVSNFALAAGSPAGVDVVLSNYGKSPALRKVSYDIVLLGPSAEDDVEYFFDAEPKTSPPVLTGGEITLVPNSPDCAKWPLPSAGADFQCVGGHVQSRGEAPNKDQVEWLLSHDFAVVLVGRIFYEDMAGNKYSTEYCFRRLATGAFAACTKRNEVR